MDYKTALQLAADLWSGIPSVEEARKINLEYLRGQVELINDLFTPYPDMDGEYQREQIAKDLFDL